MGIQRKESHVYEVDNHLLNKAERFRSAIIERSVIPERLVTITQASDALHGWAINDSKPIVELSTTHLGKGDEVIVDFGKPHVGSISLGFKPIGSPPDAPLHVRLTFGEMPIEVKEDFASYSGWISSSWLQQESLHIDILPNVITLPRRYSFRYLKVVVLDTSPKYQVVIDHISVKHQTSACRDNVDNYDAQSILDHQIDQISLKTLENCMQEVFEDGPKRDRRLWLGDLRLQAIANYETFKNFDLVKHDLYLFAATTNYQGQVSANVFIHPNVIPDDTYLFDYSLLFAVTLFDFYKATNDINTLKELWPIALKQVEIALENVDENGIVIDHPDEWWAFFDWNDNLNKQASAQAILIYTLDRVIQMATIIEDERRNDLLSERERLVHSAITYLFDEEQGFFISGENRQISWSSQVWMVLADILDKDQAKALLKQTLSYNPNIKLVTPYMHHYLVEALIHTGLRDEAKRHIDQYWGEMVRLGADTFWELFDPDEPSYSPYGSPLINSYCHAWSCTPTYFLRKYFNDNCTVEK